MRSLALLAMIFLPLFNLAQRPHGKLVWADEFDQAGLPDSSKWSYETGGDGWGNNELQYYTAGRLENARVKDGMLIIEARKENYPVGGEKPMAYTSARLVTRGKGEWLYGRIEVKARIPDGRGTWPAIWMLGSVPHYNWPDDGEIDIMEHVGYDQSVIHATVHCKKYNHVMGTQKSDTMRVADCSTRFHVYGMEWNKDSISMSIDGLTYFTFRNEHTGADAWPFDHPEFLLLNIAVGGNWGGAKGVDESIWPRRMEVDYVRVWQ